MMTSKNPVNRPVLPAGTTNSQSRTQNPEPKQAKQDKASHCARCSEWIDLMDQTFERARAFRKAIAFWGVSVRGLLARAGTWLDDKALLEAVEEAISRR